MITRANVLAIPGLAGEKEVHNFSRGMNGVNAIPVPGLWTRKDEYQLANTPEDEREKFFKSVHERLLGILPPPNALVVVNTATEKDNSSPGLPELSHVTNSIGSVALDIMERFKGKGPLFVSHSLPEVVKISNNKQQQTYTDSLRARIKQIETLQRRIVSLDGKPEDINDYLTNRRTA